jgi:hypothetical protein
MTSPVTIVAMFNQALSKVTLSQSGPSAATVQTRVWNPGSDPNGNPDKDVTIALTNCVASADGSLFDSLGPHVLWFQPKVMITLAAPKTTPPTWTVEVNVGDAGPESGDTVARISQADFTSAIAWVRGCGFPLLVD